MKRKTAMMLFVAARQAQRRFGVEDALIYDLSNRKRRRANAAQARKKSKR